MKKINEVVDYLKSKITEEIDVAIVLGSGLSNIVDRMEVVLEIPFDEIPYFKASKVVGHESKVVLAKYEGKTVLALKGRFHYYEGYDIEQVVLPIRALAFMGVKNLILTNACGGISDHLNAGDIMIISDQIGMFCPSPLRGVNIEELGTRFPDMTNVYDKELREQVKTLAKNINVEVKEGVYAYWFGPMYETPAEIKAYKALGADAVGMSTIPEAIVATHAGMKVLGISLITNKAAGLGGTLNHKEVIEVAKIAEEKNIKLVQEIIKELY